MEINIQAAADIMDHSNKKNPFEYKILSNNASHQNIKLYCQAFILNKLSLIPFSENMNFIQLYRQSLENIIESHAVPLAQKAFINDLVTHLERWHIQTESAQSWPYTRSAFYYLENQLKKQGQIALMEQIILRRAILQPNKHQFFSQASNMTFKDQRLNLLRNTKKNQMEEDENKIKDQKQNDEIQLKDILFLSDNKIWINLLKFELNNQQKQQAADYLEEYQKKGLERLIKQKLKINSKQTLIQDIELRKRVYIKYMDKVPPKFEMIISNLKKKI